MAFQELTRLSRAADRLGGVRRRGKRLPAVLVFSDPGRLPDLSPLARQGPRGLGLVARTFGDAAAGRALPQLVRQARARGQVVLAGASEALAATTRADGVHLPERLAHLAPAIRARHPLWWITIAAHSPAAAFRARRAGADAIILSAIFPSTSPSARRPIGPHRLAILARGLQEPVYALGGVNQASLGRLRNVAGIALVGAALS